MNQITRKHNWGRGWKIDKMRRVRYVDGESDFPFVIVPVVGNSLKKIGILAGDLLICRLSDNYFENKLHLVQTGAGLTTKFVRRNADGSLTLSAGGPGLESKERTYAAEKATIVGVVVRVERDL